MKRTIKFALVASSAVAVALGAAAVNAHPEGGWGAGMMGYGGQGYYGMGPGHMGYGGPGYGMGPGHMGYGGPGYGMGQGRMGYGGPGYGRGPGSGMGIGGLLGGDPREIGERLDAIKSSLGITDNQQAAWQGFADTAKQQAQRRAEWFQKMHDAQAPRTTPEWLAQRDAMMKQQQAEAEASTAAFRKLYDALSPEQRAVLDRGPVAEGPGAGWCLR